jgi:hypothetical protein
MSGVRQSQIGVFYGGGAMSVVAVWSWASEPADVEAVRAALSELVVHCEAEHPLIQRLDWLEASENSGGPVEFRWIEE